MIVTDVLAASIFVLSLVVIWLAFVIRKVSASVVTQDELDSKINDISSHIQIRDRLVSERLAYLARKMR